MEHQIKKRDVIGNSRNLNIAPRNHKISVPQTHAFRNTFAPTQAAKMSASATNATNIFKKPVKKAVKFDDKKVVQSSKNTTVKSSSSKKFAVNTLSKNGLLCKNTVHYQTALSQKNHDARDNAKKSKVYLDKVVAKNIQSASSGKTNQNSAASTRLNRASKKQTATQVAMRAANSLVNNSLKTDAKVNKSGVQSRNQAKQPAQKKEAQPASAAHNLFPKSDQVKTTKKGKILASLSRKNKTIKQSSSHVNTVNRVVKTAVDAKSGVGTSADMAPRSPFDPLPVTVEKSVKEKTVKKRASHFSTLGKNLKKQMNNLNKKIVQKEQKAEQVAAQIVQHAENNLLAEPEPALNPAIGDMFAPASTENFASQVLAAEISDNGEKTEPLAASHTDKPTKKDAPTNSMRNLQVNSAGAATIEKTNPANLLSKMASQKVTFTFKINIDKLFSFVRILAILLILAVSGYLAWDTWMTNRAVNDTFSQSSPASAMSIATANPATADATSVSKQAYGEYTVPADQPRYIKIPSIGVNARVMTVGVTSDGNIDAPQNLNDTAWYDGSAKPDQEGQVFIDGHTSFASHLAAAFNALPQLKKGAKITVELGSGKKVNYTVTKTESADANKIDMSKVLSTQGASKKGLSLMTCTGTFNYRTQTSDKRFLVYAEQDD